ncbi:MAG TPA: carboxypeptidase-like regulatory domain-containing protein [Gemmatimonadaceae bacterium]|nr:carboxypeptidase-like regulatory domain-containing protein [Gemmatimonadaceae bacterium]
MRPLICGTAIVLAACYNNPDSDLTAASTGTLTGTVISNTGSPLANVSVTANPELGGPQTAASNGNGQYTISNIPFGPGSIGVGGVPSGCQPTGAGYSMPSSFGTVTVNVTVHCGITTGTVGGTVTSTQGGAIVGAIVTITPTGGHPLATVTSDMDGFYSDASVPASPTSGTVAVSGLPTGCTAPAPVAYSGLSVLGTVTANIVVSCQTTATAIGLWVDGQYGLTAAQLAASSTPTPTDSCPGANSTISGGVGPEAFDASGNLWTARVNAVVEWSASQLTDACSPATPTITIPFPTTTYGFSNFAFDPHGTLWISTGSGALVGLSAAQLGASATPTVTPAYTINGLQPGGLAFDASGNLWVGTAASIIEYTPTQLAAATTGAASPTPTRSFKDSLANYEATYDFLAFDAHGNLWVSLGVSYQSMVPGDTVYYTQYADSLLEFSATQLGNLASNATPKPVVSIGETITQDNAAITFGALAFDGSGNLWLGLNGANGGGGVVRYPAGSVSSNSQPDITVSSPNGTGYGTSLAFNPTPTGLPISGARITARNTPHIVQAKRAKQRYR